MVAAIMATGVVGGVATGAGGGSAHPAQNPVVVAPPASSTAAAPPVVSGFEVADAARPAVALYSTPNVASGRTMSNPTSEGVPLVFLVKQDQGDWLNVQIPSRPNGATAWVHRSDVNLRRVPNHIQVLLGARRLTVYQGDQALGSYRVAIGAPSGPTPTGDFYIDAVVVLHPDTGVYGSGQLSVTAFSDVYHTFGGGVGEIAIHGTNDPALIGGTVSHGCLRMLNGDWLQLQAVAPTGTPVQILP
ncbi:MAG: L,D-transpeptidase [Actinomycetota bacterium]|nr:L,D-transpeptidase [Actinomycetota bacterium]